MVWDDDFKKINWVFRVTDFEIIAGHPTSTLKLKLKIDTNHINIYLELQHTFMAFRPV